MYNIYQSKFSRMIILLSIISGSVIGQSFGSLEGRILNKETKQPIPFANVYVMKTNYGAAANENGEYIIKKIPEGVYKLKYSAVGYGSHVETNIRVVSEKINTVKDIELLEKSITTDSVIISAGYFSSDMTEGVTTYTYNRDEIIRSPGATGDIFRAIETLPGVSSSGGEFSAISVRGNSPKDNLVIIDGIPIERVSHFEGGSEEDEIHGGRFSMFAPGLIEEANFQAGGFGVEYGGKLASVINLKIKEGNKKSSRVNGTYDLLGWEINYDGPTYILDNTSLMFSARYQNFNKILEIIDQREVGQLEFSDFIFKASTEITPRHKFSLLGIYSPEEYERNVENILATKDGNYTSHIGSTSETKQLLGGTWRFLTGDRSFLQNTLYYKGTVIKNYFGKAYIDPFTEGELTIEKIRTNADYLKIDNSEHEYGIKSKFSYSPNNSSNFIFGLDFSQLKFNYRTIQDGPDTNFVFDGNDNRNNEEKYIIRHPDLVNNTYSGGVFNLATYTEYKFTLGNRLTVIPGLRYEYNDFNKTSYLSPRIRTVYQLTERIKLKTAAGIYYQNPDLRYIAEYKGNKGLRNEKAIHYLVGFSKYISEDIRFSVEFYYKDFFDLITHQDRTTNIKMNEGIGFARGIDLGLVKKFTNKWYGRINYSYSNSKRKENDDYVWYDSDFNRPHVFNILFGYELNKNLSFSVKWRYSSGRPKDSYLIHEDVIQNSGLIRYSKEIIAKNVERLDPLHTLNLRVDYRHEFRNIPLVNNLTLIAFLDILNVYNHLNVNKEEFNPVTGKVVKQGFEMLPTLGFRLEI